MESKAATYILETLKSGKDVIVRSQVYRVLWNSICEYDDVVQYEGEEYEVIQYKDVIEISKTEEIEYDGIDDYESSQGQSEYTGSFIDDSPTPAPSEASGSEYWVKSSSEEEDSSDDSDSSCSYDSYGADEGCGSGVDVEPYCDCSK